MEEMFGGGSNHQDLFGNFHAFLSHFWSQDRNPMGTNPMGWMLQNADKIPNPQDIFKSMIQAGADRGDHPDQLAPIQSILDQFGGGAFK